MLKELIVSVCYITSSAGNICDVSSHTSCCFDSRRARNEDVRINAVLDLVFDGVFEFNINVYKI